MLTTFHETVYASETAARLAADKESKRVMDTVVVVWVPNNMGNNPEPDCPDRLYQLMLFDQWINTCIDLGRPLETVYCAEY